MNYLVPCFLFLLALKGTHSLDEICAKRSDCTTINALCVGGKCICDDFSYYNGTLCLQYVTEYNAICYEKLQCDWLGDNSDCTNNRCVCAENFKWYRGKCQKYADKGEDCATEDVLCYNGYDLLSLNCSNDVCACRTGYYNRGPDCRKSVTISGECALDLDCGFLFKCVLGKCNLKLTSYTIEDNFLEDSNIEVSSKAVNILHGEDKLPCERDNDCIEMSNSLCDISNNMCGCPEDTHYLYNGHCVQGLSHCENENECIDFSNNTMCYRNSCICKPGFFLQQNKCISELGMPDPFSKYTTDSDCPIKPGQLLDSVCYCKNYWFNDESNRNCIKTMIQSTNSCLTNEWCAAMGPYAFCNSTSNTCQCSSIAEFNEKTYYCDKVSNNSGICRKDIDCRINERCLDEQCECSENFSKSNDEICAPDISGSCAMSSCDHIKNSFCLGGLCACEDDYIGKGSKCLKIANSLESPCEEQEQCQYIDHAICGESEEYNDTLRCVCEQDYTDVRDTCYQIKKYGDPCMSEEECTLVLNRSYKCRDSVCQCDVALSLKNGYCVSSGNHILASFFLMAVLVKLVGFW